MVNEPDWNPSYYSTGVWTEAYIYIGELLSKAHCLTILFGWYWSLPFQNRPTCWLRRRSSRLSKPKSLKSALIERTPLTHTAHFPSPTTLGPLFFVSFPGHIDPMSNWGSTKQGLQTPALYKGNFHVPNRKSSRWLALATTGASFMDMD